MEQFVVKLNQKVKQDPEVDRDVEIWAHTQDRSFLEGSWPSSRPTYPDLPIKKSILVRVELELGFVYK